MRRFDWGNGILYGSFTALALALVLAFMRFLADRTGGISLAILIAGGAASCAIAAYLVLRWYLSTWLGREIGQRVEQVVTSSNRFFSDDATPLLRRDVKDLVVQVKAVGPELWRYARSLLAVIAFMAVTVELLALANAAVMYVQAQRIDEQNQLLEVQNRAQLAAFLNDVLSSVGTTNTILNEARRVRNVVAEDLLSPFDVLDEFATTLANGQVTTRDFRPEVCEGEPDDCDDLALQEFVSLVQDGPFLLTDDNAAAVRGYARLARAAELILQPFTVDFGDETSSLNADVTAFGDAIANAVATCGSENLQNSAAEAWQGVSGVGFGATQMFDSNVDIATAFVPGVTVDLLATDVLTVASGVGIIAQTLERNDDLMEGPRGASVLLADGIIRLRDELVALVERCDLYQQELERTIVFLNTERARVLADIEESNVTE